MSLRAAGTAFCGIAAFLFAFWYLGAVVGGNRLVQFIGEVGLPVAAFLSLLVGMGYLWNASLKELSERRDR